jgi:hypothetical protein
LTLAWFKHASQHLNCRSFTRTIVAKQGKNLSLVDSYVDTLYSASSVVINFEKVVDAQVLVRLLKRLKLLVWFLKLVIIDVNSLKSCLFS